MDGRSLTRSLTGSACSASQRTTGEFQFYLCLLNHRPLPKSLAATLDVASRRVARGQRSPERTANQKPLFEYRAEDEIPHLFSAAAAAVESTRPTLLRYEVVEGLAGQRAVASLAVATALSGGSIVEKLNIDAREMLPPLLSSLDGPNTVDMDPCPLSIAGMELHNNAQD